MEPLLRIRNRCNNTLVVIGGVALVSMVALTCGNILLRIVWFPIRGTFELMGFLGAVVAAFALGYTQLGRGHIAVSVLVDRFSPGTRRVLEGINDLVCTLFFALVAWQIANKAVTLWRTGEVTETLRIPYYPFTAGVALGFALLSWVALTDLLQRLWGRKEGPT